MPKFQVAVDHSVERDIAIARLRNFSQQVLAEAPVEVTEVEEVWDEDGNLDFAFRALGLRIEGTVVTCSSFVTVAGKLPFAAVPFRGQIEKQIESKVREALG